jgi:hypothetical protein
MALKWCKNGEKWPLNGLLLIISQKSALNCKKVQKINQNCKKTNTNFVKLIVLFF